MKTRLEIIGDDLTKLFTRLEKTKKNSMKLKDGEKPSIFLAIGTDRSKNGGKSLVFDAYDRDNMNFYQYVEAIVFAINSATGQTDDDGNYTTTSQALLEAIVNFVAMYCIDDPKNQERFNGLLEMYSKQKTKA